MVLLQFLLQAKHQIFALAAEHDLSAMQVITLLLLEQPLPMRSLKTCFNCDPSNVTGIIDGLQQRGLVSRYEHADDRRIKMIKLLAPGERLRASLLRRLAQSDSVALSRLTPDQLKTFLGLLQIVAGPACQP
jgi:DNA-binding MarR family transcriptional regulator